MDSELCPLPAVQLFVVPLLYPFFPRFPHRYLFLSTHLLARPQMPFRCTIVRLRSTSTGAGASITNNSTLVSVCACTRLRMPEPRLRIALKLPMTAVARAGSGGKEINEHHEEQGGDVSFRMTLILIAVECPPSRSTFDLGLQRFEFSSLARAPRPASVLFGTAPKSSLTATPPHQTYRPLRASIPFVTGLHNAAGTPNAADIGKPWSSGPCNVGDVGQNAPPTQNNTILKERRFTTSDSDGWGTSSCMSSTLTSVTTDLAPVLDIDTTLLFSPRNSLSTWGRESTLRAAAFNPQALGSPTSPTKEMHSGCTRRCSPRRASFEVLVILDALDALKDGWKSRGNHNDNAEDFLSPLTYKQLMCTRRILLTLWLEEFGPRGGSEWAMTPRWPPDGTHLPPLPRGTGWGCERATTGRGVGQGCGTDEEPARG
ncbi:hypothetical protein DFH08DRAFT_813983 [Mycena albidolilacea]|uniref:Uncharacterized protein n=1 Tax=Mycena albidolilacea TaxID=1033008 RepID=A0AAD7EKW8_9AGAR|nr:hypothetical protein DFH08DRAFT_813983 [Mycena albidolilacea]